MTDVTVPAEEMTYGDHLFLTDQYVVVKDVKRAWNGRVQVGVQAKSGVVLLLFYDRGEQVVVRRDGHKQPVKKKTSRSKKVQQDGSG